MANLSMRVEDQSTKKVRLSSSRRYWNRRSRVAYLFLLPYILFMLAFGLGPGIYALIISFADYSTGLPRYFAAGIKNYLAVFKESRFVFTFANIGKFLLISVPVGIALVVLLALLLHMRPGRVASPTLRPQQRAGTSPVAPGPTATGASATPEKHLTILHRRPRRLAHPPRCHPELRGIPLPPSSPESLL